MMLLYIFILGCFVTAFVGVGVLFALAAAGYDTESRTAVPSPPDSTPGLSEFTGQETFRL